MGIGFDVRIMTRVELGNGTLRSADLLPMNYLYEDMSNQWLLWIREQELISRTPKKKEAKLDVSSVLNKTRSQGS